MGADNSGGGRRGKQFFGPGDAEEKFRLAARFGLAPRYPAWILDLSGALMNTMLRATLALAALAWTTSLQAADTGRLATLTVTTSPAGGKYAPRHVLAVWITDAGDHFVRTVEVRAGRRQKYLYAWRAARGDRAPDGISGATLKTHEPLTFRWDGRDADGRDVPDGTYRWHVELTDRHQPGPVTPADHLEFTVGPEASSRQPADLPNFRALSVTFTPGTPP
jgi:hypothetical protein